MTAFHEMQQIWSSAELLHQSEGLKFGVDDKAYRESDDLSGYCSGRSRW